MTRRCARGATEGFAVQPSWNGVAYERAQTALRLVDSEPALAPRALLSRLVGLRRGGQARRVLVPSGAVTPKGWAELNEAQSEAVRRSLQQAVTTVQGPPGCGKTKVIAAVCYHAVQRGRGQVLVCAPSNTAVTRVAEVLLGMGLKVLRLFTRARDTDMLALPEAMQLATHAREVETEAAIAVRGLLTLKEELGLTGADASLLQKLQDVIVSGSSMTTQ